jgi:hypothetical protein
MKWRRHFKGLSLMEILFGVALMALIGTGLVVMTSGASQRASTQAVASRMLEIFRQAREQAVASQIPTAVVIPATSSQALASTCYIVSGLQQPVVTRRIDFSSEFPGTYLFAGHWSVSGATNQAPSPLQDANEMAFDLGSWSPPDPSHAIYCFTPVGTVVSNQIEFDGAYHMIVCRNALWGSGTVGGVPSAVLSAVDSPTTLTLGKSGLIKSAPSVARSSGVTINEMEDYSGAVIDSPNPNLSANAAPVIQLIEVAPKPEPATLPPGIDATVATDGYLTLHLEAVDPEGEPLNVEWVSEDVNNSSAPSGSFSSPIRTETDPESGLATSLWEWRPPPSAVPGDQYELTATVTDLGGASATGQVGAAGQILALEPGTILFVDDRNGNREVYTMNSDGTNEVRLSRSGGDEAWPQLSPDGSRVMYVLNQGASSSLMTMSINGDRPTQVLTPASLPPHPPGTPHDAIVSCCWSPDGSRIAVIARYGGPSGGHDVYVCNVDGSGIFKPHSDAPVGGLSVTGAAKVTWHFDPPYDRNDLTSQRLLYTSPFDNQYFAFFLDPPRRSSEVVYSGTVEDINAGPDGRVAWIEGGNVHVGNFTEGGIGLASTNVVGGSVSNPAGPAWSPTASSLVFSGGGAPSIFRVESNGSNLVQLTQVSGAQEASWGP